jgi:hypothetical protein
MREQEASLPAGQLSVDPPTGHSGGETPAELNPRPFLLCVPIGHRPKLPPKPIVENLAPTGAIPAKEANDVLRDQLRLRLRLSG